MIFEPCNSHQGVTRSKVNQLKTPSARGLCGRGFSVEKQTGATKLKHQRHFERETPSREAVQTRSLISDIDRVVQILNSDIAAEEEQARVFDPSQARYPMLARKLAARRDNLRGTIAVLEKRLSDLANPVRFCGRCDQHHGRLSEAGN